MLRYSRDAAVAAEKKAKELAASEGGDTPAKPHPEIVHTVKGDRELIAGIIEASHQLSQSMSTTARSTCPFSC